MRTELDDLLDASGPVIPTAPGVHAQLRALASSHASARRTRISGRTALLAAVLSVMLVGGASTAAIGAVRAAGWEITDPDFEFVRAYPADPSITCEVRIRFEPEQDQAPTAADYDQLKQFFDDVDLQSVTTDPELASLPGVPGASAATTELNAFNWTVFALWAAPFQTDNLEPLVWWSSESRCSDADDHGFSW